MHGVRFTVNDHQERTSRHVGVTAALLPVSDGIKSKTELGSKLGLRQPHLFANSPNIYPVRDVRDESIVLTPRIAKCLTSAAKDALTGL